MSRLFSLSPQNDIPSIFPFLFADDSFIKIVEINRDANNNFVFSLFLMWNADKKDITLYLLRWINCCVNCSLL